jgi:glutamyl-tRNA synthetase
MYIRKWKHFSYYLDEYLQQGLPHVVRFSLPTDHEGTQIYEDLVYGHHEHNPYATEGDFILLKSDGYPTYHLANVIDDHLMDISHVLRGHEWQTSTSKHLLLYKAFNWQPPTYGHLSLLERERGRKLSKRDKENAINPIEIDYYRQKGYYPDAILNFITLCGGGGFSDVDTVIGKTLDEMISLFNIKLFSRHAAIVDFKKLSICQRAHLKREYQKSNEGRQHLIEELRQKVLHYYPEKNPRTSIQLQNDYLEKTMNMIDFRIILLDELFANNLYEYLWKEPEIQKDLIDNVEQFRFVIQRTLTNIDRIHFTHDDVKQFVEEFKPNKISSKQVFRIWRLVLCGCLQGPPVHEIATFFGSDIVRKRFENAIRLLDQQSENVQVKL